METSANHLDDQLREEVDSAIQSLQLAKALNNKDQIDWAAGELRTAVNRLSHCLICIGIGRRGLDPGQTNDLAGA